jgi:hypothetical protein
MACVPVAVVFLGFLGVSQVAAAERACKDTAHVARLTKDPDRAPLSPVEKQCLKCLAYLQLLQYLFMSCGSIQQLCQLDLLLQELRSLLQPFPSVLRYCPHPTS